MNQIILTDAGQENIITCVWDTVDSKLVIINQYV